MKTIQANSRLKMKTQTISIREIYKTTLTSMLNKHFRKMFEQDCTIEPNLLLHKLNKKSRMIFVKILKLTLMNSLRSANNKTNKYTN